MECAPWTVHTVNRKNGSGELRWAIFQLSQWEQGWYPGLDINLDFKDLVQLPAVLQISSVILGKLLHASRYSQTVI